MKKVFLGEVIKDARSGFASGEKDEQGVAQIRMNNVTTDGDLDLSSIRRVPRNSVKNVEAFILEEGHVLFNSTNSSNLVGKSVRFVRQHEPFVFSNHFLRLVPDPEQLDSRFLARWLTYQQQQGVFELLCTKWVNQAAVRRDDLLSLTITLPPLPEQRRIAAILDAADGLRAKRRAALGKLDALLQSVFLEMFGDPGNNPNRWETRLLGQLMNEVYRYPTYYDITYLTDGVPEIRGELIGNDGHIVTEGKQFRYISQETSKKYPRTILVEGDLVMSVRGTIGKIALVPRSLSGANITANLMRISPNPALVSPIYVWYIMRSEYFRQQLANTSSSTTILTIKAPNLKSIPLPLPPLHLQKRFAGHVTTIERLKSSKLVTKCKLDLLFASLQQRAFRGEL